MTDHDRFMALAIEQAKLGLGLTSPNPPVGAIIVKDNQIISTGFHKAAGQKHAEIEALQAARSSVKGATLYVTLEPCSTTGRTGACTDAIKAAGVDTVVVGCKDPNPAHQGQGLAVLRDAAVNVIEDVKKFECEQLIKGFACLQIKKRPYVIAKIAITLDGIARLPEDMGRWISCEESRSDVQRIRSEVDAIMVGGATLRADNPYLTIRDSYAERRPAGLQTVIVSNTANIPKDLNVFKQSKEPWIYINQELTDVLKDLGDLGISMLLVESGGRLINSLAAAHLLDELIIYIAPYVAGKGGQRYQFCEHSWKWKHSEWQAIGQDMRFRGWDALS